jgi:hypothetical protein
MEAGATSGLRVFPDAQGKKLCQVSYARSTKPLDLTGWDRNMVESKVSSRLFRPKVFPSHDDASKMKPRTGTVAGAEVMKGSEKPSLPKWSNVSEEIQEGKRYDAYGMRCISSRASLRSQFIPGANSVTGRPYLTDSIPRFRLVTLGASRIDVHQNIRAKPRLDAHWPTYDRNERNVFCLHRLHKALPIG